MIKINLLPPRIAEEKAIKQVALLFGVLTVVVIGGCLAFSMKINNAASAMSDQAAVAEEFKRQTDDWNTKKKDRDDFAANIKAKVDFVQKVDEFNLQYPKLYEELAKFTYSKVIYSKLTPAVAQGAGTLQIDAFASNITDAGRYLLNLYRATTIFSGVQLTGIPGYPSTPGSSSMGGALGLSQPATMASSYSTSMPGYGGLNAIGTGVERSEVQKAGFPISVTCTIKPDIVTKNLTAPVANVAGGGGAGAPGAFGAPGTPGM